MKVAETIRADRDEALDGLRGIAALMVVFFHCGVGVAFSPIFIPGNTGVHLFFVLSGYLISRPFLASLIEGRPLPSWRNYAARRFMRIYPTYFVALVAFVAMRFVADLRRPSAGDVLRHALLIFNWGTPAEFTTINIAMWTLAIESQFYVLLPLAAALAKAFSAPRRRTALFLCCAFVIIGLGSRGLEYSLSVPGEPRFRLPFSYLDLFAMGMFVGFWELERAAYLRKKPTARTGLLLLAAIVLLGSNYWQVVAGGSDWLSPPSRSLLYWYPLLICAGFALLLLALLTRATDRVAVLMSTPLTFVGRISYSMYLFHVGIGFFLLTHIPPGPGRWLGMHPPFYALAQLGPVLLVSYIVYRAVELPSLRWVESFSLRRRAQKQVAPS